jgi:hypothetical protein
MGTVINSDWDDAAAAVTKDGKSLYLTSNRPDGYGGYDLWVSQRDSEEAPWGHPANLGPVVNGPYVEVSSALSRDGHWMAFHTNRPGGQGGFDLMVSWRQYTHDDFAWEAPVHLTTVNSAADDQSPAFFEGEDGLELYFSSTRAGGLGGSDIYVCRMNEDGTFSTPELVPELSTASGENGVELNTNGLEVYLSSNRAGAQGLYDIFVSTRASIHDLWAEPVPVTQLNSPWGDAAPALLPDGLTLIFNSGRATNNVTHDLYMTRRYKWGGVR